jgi:hypothetical protein
MRRREPSPSRWAGALVAGITCLAVGCPASGAARAVPTVSVEGQARQARRRGADLRRRDWELGVRVDATWTDRAGPAASAGQLPPRGDEEPPPPPLDLGTVRRRPGDPPVHSVVAQVLDAVRRAETASPDDLRARARNRGWVPELRVEARRGRGRDLSARQDGGDFDRLDASTDDDLTLTGRLVFRLDRLVFAPEETTISREARARQQALRSLAREVVALYYERRRLLLSLARPGGDRGQRADALVRVAEIEAELTVLAGGASPFARDDPD